MATVKILEKYHDTVIAFGDNGFQLKRRTQGELIELGIIAHQSGNPNLLKLFEVLPSLSELQAMKMKRLIKSAKIKK